MWTYWPDNGFGIENKTVSLIGTTIFFSIGRVIESFAWLFVHILCAGCLAKKVTFCYEPLPVELPLQLALTNANLNSSKGKRTEIASFVVAPVNLL